MVNVYFTTNENPFIHHVFYSYIGRGAVYILEVCYATQNLCMCSIHKTLQKIPPQNNSSHSSLQIPSKTQKFTLFTSIPTSIKPFIQAKNQHFSHTKIYQILSKFIPQPSKNLINKAFSRTHTISKHFHHISTPILLSQIIFHHPSTLPLKSKTSLL